MGLITYKDITKSKDRPNAAKDSKGRLRLPLLLVCRAMWKIM